MHPMQNKRNYVPPLVSLCLERLTKDNTRMLNNLDLLVQTIDMVTMPEEKQLTVTKAMTTLNAVSTITQEYGIFRVCPISIGIKGLPGEIAEESELRNLFHLKNILGQLYYRSSVIKRNIDFYESYPDSVRLLVASGIEDIPLEMRSFLYWKKQDERLKQADQDQKAIDKDCDYWFPGYIPRHF